MEMIYKVEDDGYNGAHYDHHGYWLRAIREGRTMLRDPIFGFRVAVPALLCNDSYFRNTRIHWDPVKMKLV